MLSRCLSRPACRQTFNQCSRNYIATTSSHRYGLHASRSFLPASSAMMITPYAHTPLYTTQTRSMVLKDFLDSFRKNLKKNIKQEPEFGGDLKRLQETKESVTDVAKNTTTTGSSFSKKLADRMKGTISSTVEGANKIAKEKRDQIKDAAAPYVDDALEEAKENFKKVVDVEQLKETTESINAATEEASKVIKETAKQTSKIYQQTAEQTSKIVQPVTDTVSKTVSSVTDSEIGRGISALKHASGTKPVFNPTPLKKKKEVKSYSTAIVAAPESRWSKTKEKISRQWSELGDSNSRLSYFVEAVDSWSERWKRISSSPMGIMVSNLRKEYPDFDIDIFKDWVETTLIPRVLNSKKYDSFVEDHSGELIKQLYKTKQLPLPWKIINISSSEVFPAQETDLNSFKFFFRVQLQAKEFNKEREKEIVYNIVLILVTRLTEDKVWILSEFQELEKEEAFF